MGASVAAASVLVYFISGLAKFLGNGRWDGSNPWRSLIRPPFNLVAGSRLYFGNACCHRIDDGAVPLRARHDRHEPGGIWRSQYGQESTGDFGNYRAIKIHTKATGFGPDEASLFKS